VIPLLCPVRGCGLPLERAGGSMRCAEGHAFDLARSGYVNLLQPQERRAARPGDRREAVLARRRLMDGGYAGELTDRFVAAAGSLGGAAAVLDTGCGEGSHLGRLAERVRIDCIGVDISTDAVDLAARRYPGLTWVVANADRRLPFPDGSFDLIASITARRNPREFVRLIRGDGRLFIALPAPDDLAELREAVQGESGDRSRADAVTAELGESFELVSHETVRTTAALGRETLLDLLDATYRGLRHSERERVASLGSLAVTFAWDVMTFRPRK
jgi:23S rRNA (guanine745-N1)-methyltransferase